MLYYPNLCFVDTLDNVAGLRRYTGQHVGDLFGMGEENIERIKRQNRRKISVVIGNPPYNANQANENDNNKNREYPDIDARIKDTYIKASTAQKTKLYDMYARFFRWASDRIAENGVVAFVTNRSYIESRTFDGFRDVRAGPEKPDGRLSGISASPWAKMPASRGAESEEETPSYPLTGVQSEGGAGRRPRREDAGRIGQAA